MSTTSTRRIFKDLQASGLLNPDQIAEVRGRTHRSNSPTRFLSKLVAAGAITKWQARKLYQGTTKFFHGKGNKYKLLRKIGRGGMGVVYKAEQVSIGRTVALKVMSAELMKSDRNVSRFLREIQITATLDHPNIIRAFDADLDDETYFLVMEYLRGRNMREWLSTSGKQVSCATACDLIMQAAKGLQYVHESELVHRDIKPSNLFLTIGPEGRMVVKLLDLGLSRITTDSNVDGGLTRAGHGLGTLWYMSPEQVKAEKDIDIRADIYALGCTLFELLTRRLPFVGTNPLKTAVTKLKETAPRVSSVRPDIPPELDDIVARMLQRERDGRYATPNEVVAALSEVKHQLARQKADRATPVKVTGPLPDDSTFSDVTFVAPDASHESLSSPDTAAPGSLTLELERLSDEKSVASNSRLQNELAAIEIPTPASKSLSGVHQALACNVGRVTALGLLGPTADNVRQAVLSSMILGTWAAFESLAGDLWEAALNANPQWALLAGDRMRIRRLAEDDGGSDEQAMESLQPIHATLFEMCRLTNGSFNLSNKMGTLLRSRFDFSTLRGIREAYATALHPESTGIDSSLADKSLDAIERVKDVLLHNAGVAEVVHVQLDQCAAIIPSFDIGSTIQCDSEAVANLTTPVVQSAATLLNVVDSQIAAAGN